MYFGTLKTPDYLLASDFSWDSIKKKDVKN